MILEIILTLCIIAPTLCQCPGSCLGSETCCPDGSDDYSCCPYSSAICCSDHRHCCPSGYTCDITHGQCISEMGQMDTPALTPLHRTDNVTVPDDCPSGTCPTTDTCCSLIDGGYGCCPLPEAVCCPDRQHCCPQGFVCDMQNSQCVPPPVSLGNPDNSLTDVALVEIGPQNRDDCPSTSVCPSNETCCDLGFGQFGCCPYVNAFCCSNLRSCCPNGYKCDSSGNCQNAFSHDSLASSFLLSSIEVAPCPTGTCPIRETCCPLPNGQFGCCLYSDANCCIDQAHCCPKGYRCLPSGQCTNSLQDITAGYPILSAESANLQNEVNDEEK